MKFFILIGVVFIFIIGDSIVYGACPVENGPDCDTSIILDFNGLNFAYASFVTTDLDECCKLCHADSRCDYFLMLPEGCGLSSNTYIPNGIYTYVVDYSGNSIKGVKV